MRPGFFCRRPRAKARLASRHETRKRKTLRLDHQVDRLGAFALLVRLNLEGDALSFGQILQSRPFDRGDVHEHIASAIVRLDEAVAAFSIEELDRPSHGHRETPPPQCSTAARTSRSG